LSKVGNKFADSNFPGQ